MFKFEDGTIEEDSNVEVDADEGGSASVRQAFVPPPLPP